MSRTPVLPHLVHIGLGANLGDREANLRAALRRLDTLPGVAVEAVSSLRETAPVGGPEQPPYLNGVARLRTSLEPEVLLGLLKALEREAGREPDGPRFGPRPLDLDILLFGERVVDRRELQVPHPRLFERAFVLEPLAELGVDPRALPRPERPMVEREAAAFAARCAAWRRGGCALGLVPTMGALHEGHAALIRRARAECDRVAVTIFVNPLQFGPHEDLSRYPRPLEADLRICAAEGADLVFVPAVETVYPPGFCSRIEVGAEARGMEGEARPGHFAGVATVVAKLWSLAGPDRAYFGRKDAQQVAVLRRLRRDLGLSGELVECAIVREPDGLARSSRNVYLGPEDRAAAVAVSRALAAAAAAHRGGERRAERLVEVAREVLAAEPRCVGVDYLELRGDEDLAPWPGGRSVDRARLLVAARFGRPPTRLLDNRTLGAEDAE
jgi:pantoate--beta-alanine ligase